MPRDPQPFLHLRVPVIASLGRRRMKLDRVLTLAPGAVLDLGKRADQPLDLMVNNKTVGRGVAIKFGDRLGLRITQMNPARGDSL